MTSQVQKTVLSKKQAKVAEAIESLREHLKKGDTVYTVLRSVNASGMSRYLDLFTRKNDQLLRLTWSAATVIDATYDHRKDALRVDGCGSDMGFFVVSRLARKLFGDYRALEHRWL